MRKTKYILVSALILISCATGENNEHTLCDITNFDLQPISFVAKPAISALTRAEIDIQPAVFDADEVLQGYVWYEGYPVDANDHNNWAPKMTAMAPENNQNDLVLNQSLNWPADPKKKICFYGLYPESVTKDVTSFTVEADQTTDAKYKLSDLMWAGDHTNSTFLSAKYDNNNAAQNLPFKHKMVKLIVNAFSDGSVTGLTINGVTVNHILRTIPFTPATGQLGTVSGTASEAIKMTNDGACLLPPQTVAKETELFEVSVTVDGKEYVAKYKLGNDITLEEGFQYTFALKVGAQALKLTSTITGWTSSTDTHTVTPQAFGSLMMEAVPAVTYKAAEYQVTPAVKDANGTLLTQGTHYDYSWFGNKDAGTAVVVATGKDDYDGQKAIQTFAINKALLTIKAEDKTITYGDAIPAMPTDPDNPISTDLTVTYSGFQGTDNINSLDNRPQVTIESADAYNATKREPSSTENVREPYKLTPSGAEAKNYEFNYVEGGLTIYKKKVDNWNYSPNPIGTINKGSSKSLSLSSAGDGGSDYGTLTITTDNSGKISISGTAITGVADGTASVTIKLGDGTNHIYEDKIESVTVQTPAPKTLAELKAWCVAGNNCSPYLGYWVDKNGNISSTKQSSSVARIYQLPVKKANGNVEKGRVFSLWSKSNSLKRDTDSNSVLRYSLPIPNGTEGVDYVDQISGITWTLPLLQDCQTISSNKYITSNKYFHYQQYNWNTYDFSSGTSQELSKNSFTDAQMFFVGEF